MSAPGRLAPLGWRHTLTAYRLACDPDERRNARDHSRPTWWRHLKWMWRQIHRHAYGYNHWAWIIVDKETKRRAGLVRLEGKDAELEASIVLFPAFRGKGLASWAIAEAVRLVWSGVPFTAYIRKGNRASMGAFRKAGFRFTGRVVEGLSQFVYTEDHP